MYSVIGPSSGDNSPYFYMKFFEYGRSVYSRKERSNVSYQGRDSYVGPTVNAVGGAVLDTLKTTLKKELGFDD